MTNWRPDLEDQSGPRYLAIAEALARDVAQGRLAPGDRLPTHRDLAWHLGVTVGTVTRAYGEAERRGLIAGEVGRGTFVREQLPSAPPTFQDLGSEDGLIDLSYNFPALATDHALFREELEGMARDPELNRHLGYLLGPGRDSHRAAAADWLKRAGLDARPEEIVVTCGAQHAMFLAAAALTRPGEVILTEALTYYGIKSIAEALERQLYGVALDDQGLVPDSLEAAIRSSGARVLYCIPTLQNPTTTVLPEARRRQIVEICRRHDVMIIEDDIYSFLLEEPATPLTALAPERSFYATSLSKCVAPGLRIGLLRAPLAFHEGIATALRASTLMPSGFMAELAARLIRSGKAEQAAEAKCQEAQARQSLARTVLPSGQLVTHPRCFHAWLTLPRPWRHEDFAAEARRRGVMVGSARVFAVGRQPVPHAVRLCLHAASSRRQLRSGLEILTGILRESPAEVPALV
ncbi:MAG: PLP-dependent aminotransferase family protein [Kiloniellales bacterium]|nr:PLP-dependent aminotransferase family protein [Kiloniellales bacterium]